MCSTIVNYCKHGWPDSKPTNPDIKPCWEEHGKFTIGNDLLLFGSRMVVPLAEFTS